MSEQDRMTVAEGLTELKRIAKVLPLRYRNIQQFCSKRAGSKDEIENQQDYVKKQRQSAEDLIARWQAIKVAIAKSNLETTITWKDTTMTVHEAILWKSVPGRGRSIQSMLTGLYNSFNTQNAELQINEYASISGLSRVNISDEQRQKLDLTPVRYYDEREIQKKLEELLELESKLDALIDASNHQTFINISRESTP